MPPTAISSLHNPRVKAAIRLRSARQRAKQGRIVIDGARELARAVQVEVSLVEVFVCPQLCQSDASREVLELLSASPAQVLEVTPSVFAKLAFGARAEGIVAVAETPRRTLADLKLPVRPLVAVLEGVEKPGNVGAVIRSADAAGVSALIVADGRTDLYNPNAIRASLGTIFSLAVCEATSAEALTWLRAAGFRIFTARVDGAVEYTAADHTGPTAIVLGSETAGLSNVWSADDATGITAIRLPMLGAADSLNLSAAAAVLFYEALRQRQNQANTILLSRESLSRNG